MVGAGAGGAGAGGGGATVTGGGVGLGFFAQPVHETVKASRTTAAMASVYHDLLIAVSPMSCLWFVWTFD